MRDNVRDARWQRVARECDVEEDWPYPVEIGGIHIALFRIENEIFATSGWCPHEEAPLSDGYFDPKSATIECPLHQARFHVPTGKVLCPPASEGLCTYAVLVREGEVHVDLGDGERS